MAYKDLRDFLKLLESKVPFLLRQFFLAFRHYCAVDFRSISSNLSKCSSTSHFYIIGMCTDSQNYVEIRELHIGQPGFPKGSWYLRFGSNKIHMERMKNE